MPLPRDPFATAAGRVAPESVVVGPVVPRRARAAVDLTPDAVETAEEPDPDRPVRPLSREEELPYTKLPAGAPQHDEHTAKFSRLAHSEITFGPVGRVVATAVMLALPVFLLWVSLAWILFDGIYLFFLVVGLRDIWQPVLVRRAQRSVPESYEIDRTPKT
jgi:hypothetical protein